MTRIRTLFLALATASLLVTGGVLAAGSSALRIQIVDQRGMPVRNAVVEYDSAARTSGRITFPWRMAMAQKRQDFVPGTLIVAKGSTVAFPNLDQVRHSIYSFSKAAKFSIDLYGRDQTRKQSFPIAGTVALGCSIHDDMRGYIRVVDTPYAGKTDANGMVTLTGVPSGSGKIVVWHPALRAPGNELTKSAGIRNGTSAQKIAVTLR